MNNFSPFSDDDEVDVNLAEVLDPRTGKMRKKGGPQFGSKREPFVPTQMDVEEKATIEYLRSVKVIRRATPGKS